MPPQSPLQSGTQSFDKTESHVPQLSNEPNPIESRHDKKYPMYEFESHNNINDLIELEAELLQYLGFDKPNNLYYEDACKWYNVDTIEAEQEEEMIEKEMEKIK